VSSFTYTIVDFDLRIRLVERNRRPDRSFGTSAFQRHASGIVVDLRIDLRETSRVNRHLLRNPVKCFRCEIRNFVRISFFART
jgi:hypothetical protein